MVVSTAGAVILTVTTDPLRAKGYYVSIGLATYTAYRAGVLVWQAMMRKNRNFRRLMALRSINTADLLVSALTLQAVMFAQFGANDSVMKQMVMSVSAGGAACAGLVALGVRFIWSWRRQMSRRDHIRP